MRRWPILVVVLVTAAVIATLARGMANFFLEDDAYFYLRIAWNLGRGQGSTFDGLHVTNGYHLLWMGVLASLARLLHLVGLGKDAFLFAVCALSTALAVVTSRQLFSSRSEQLLAVLLFMLCGLTMETTLLVALLLVLAQASFGERQRAPLTIAGLCALVPLSRIDYFWVPLALLAIGRFQRDDRRALPAYAVIAGVSVGVALQLGIERVAFGTWTSVSSAYKADIVRLGGFGQVAENLGSRGNQLRYLIALTLSSFGLYAGWAQRHTRRRTLTMLAIAMLPLLAYSAVSDMRDWYFAVPLLIALFIASRAQASGHWTWRMVTSGLSALVMAAAVAYLLRTVADRDGTIRFIADAQRQLTPESVVFQNDGSGFTGWWLEAHVVNGDGLVNSWDYRERLRSQQLAGYLDEIRATHVITNSVVTPRFRRTRLTVDTSLLPLVAASGRAQNPLLRFRLFAFPNRRKGR